MNSADAFDNQLISLHQIKNYAHHRHDLVHMAPHEHFTLAKDKVQ
jgi:hypothetical protein